MDQLIALVLFGVVGVVIAFWLKKRKEPKPLSPALSTISQMRFEEEVANVLQLGRIGMIEKWSALIIEKGGNYVPPNLGEGMTDEEIAKMLAEITLGGRP